MSTRIISFLKRRRAPKPIIETLPAKVPELQGAEIGAVVYGQRVGGDFYDFQRVGPDRLLFGLLDVAGHREAARAILSAAQTVFRASGQELLGPPEVNEPDAMVELCLRLNRSMMQAAGGVRSCPAFVGCYNQTLGTICYMNAGHTPGLVRDSRGVSLLHATGLPLGLFPYATGEAMMTALEPGAALLLVSRGVVEAERRREEFGIDRVKELLQEEPANSAAELGERILGSLQQFMAAPPVHNDVTALALLRRTAASAAGA